MRLRAEALTGEAFAPFGRVLDGRAARPTLVNQGRAVRTDLAHLPAAGLRFTLARYDVAPSSLPLDIVLMERHPQSEQAFFALAGGTALVVAAGTAADGSPDLSSARAFIARPETPFLYAAGTWHAPLFALGGGGAFLMGMRESGTPADCETFELTTTLRVEP
ncbi:ureidoglycolate lyase [Enterovirga aerilata]|uniref:Ureidoglycolate hydrolase n=1 Tax=Enterovirga aerilata TaxID=2730920 RepID=A0A849I7S1_9HYPH|nr:ureidoglycolate hydrolase [Enterovirga sp. DB1703]